VLVLTTWHSWLDYPYSSQSATIVKPHPCLVRPTRAVQFTVFYLKP
jgi:hypothetical protein